jgi:hypothetical protein
VYDKNGKSYIVKIVNNNDQAMETQGGRAIVNIPSKAFVVVKF